MDDERVAPWAEGVDVLKKTDTDLEASRHDYTRVTDPERTLHRYVRTLVEATGMSRSEVLDRGLRVGLADVIDSRETTITREQFDVAYTIPPAGWLVRQSLPEIELVDMDETDDMGRALGFALPSVTKEMAEAVVADGGAETVSALVRRGCAILLGHR
jgi:hypothetical protein